MREDRLTCDHCGKDTFAFRRENGLEVKYRDRWLLILNDAAGTVLFRCRVCGSTSAYHLGRGAVTRVREPAEAPSAACESLACPGQPGAAPGGDGRGGGQ